MFLNDVNKRANLTRKCYASIVALVFATTIPASAVNAQDSHRRHGGGGHSQERSENYVRRAPQQASQNQETQNNGWRRNDAPYQRRNEESARAQRSQETATPPQVQRQSSQQYWPHQTPRLPENGDNDVRSASPQWQPPQQSAQTGSTPQYADRNYSHRDRNNNGYRDNNHSGRQNYGNGYRQREQPRHGAPQPRSYSNYGNQSNYGYQNRSNSYSSNRTPNYRHYEFQNREHSHNRMGPYGNWSRWDNRWGNANDYARRWGFDAYDPYQGWRRGNRWYSHPSQWSDWGGWYSFFFGSSGLWGFSYNSGYDPYLNNYGSSCQRVETIDWIRSERAVVSFVACRNRWGNWEEIRGTREFEYWLY